MAHMVDRMEFHQHDAGEFGTILAARCGNCGCSYKYCSSCDAVDEQDEQDEHCIDPQCGCHTDTRHDLT